MGIDIDGLLAQLSLEEKVALCAGKSMWITTPVPRLGIPAMKLSDGPNAARGDAVSGATAACFPVGVALAATWDVDLIEQVGQALGEEARSKNAQVLLGPTMNLHRHPLGGRNFECYSEDPHLSGAIACGFIRGVQSRGVAACAKHFVCNDSEFERHTISSEVDERTLRELYLRPFEMSVREAGVWSVMSAYNRVNGVYASSHEPLLRGVLKGEWGFDGFVVSDWGAALETEENALGGLDLEMPGPPRTRGDALVAAVRRGAVDEALIDDSVRRILRIMARTGRFDAPDPQPEASNDLPEHRALARRAAAAAMVLIRNDGVLPFDPAKVRRLAVIGPNAARGQIQGGGSSAVVPHYRVDPLAALEAVFDEVVHAEGCAIHKYLPLPDPAQIHVEPGGAPGLRLEFHGDDDFGGPAVAQRTLAVGGTPWGFTPLMLPGGVDGVADRTRFSAVLQGVMTVPASGRYELGLLSAGLSRLYLDDELVIDNWTSQTRGDAFFGNGSTERRVEAALEAGRAHHLRIEFRSQPGLMLQGLRFGVLPPQPDDPIGEAERIAADADGVVLVVGSNPDWETEGNDRTDLALPGEQDALIRRVLAANPNTVVVVNTGAAVAMPWLERSRCVLQAWLPGQEFGNALADVVCGAENPSGRMPTTFPARLEDTPAYEFYPGGNGRVEYGEGLLVGYRWYDTRGIEPLVPFGHGLSYTRFEYGEPAVEVDRDGIALSLGVANVGERDGSEVVQVYRRLPGPPAGRPNQELCAFARVAVARGERRDVTLRIPAENLRLWDPDSGGWSTWQGNLTLAIGASSRDIRRVVEVNLP